MAKDKPILAGVLVPQDKLSTLDIKLNTIQEDLREKIRARFLSGMQGALRRHKISVEKSNHIATYFKLPEKLSAIEVHAHKIFGGRDLFAFLSDDERLQCITSIWNALMESGCSVWTAIGETPEHSRETVMNLLCESIDDAVGTTAFIVCDGGNRFEK